MFSLCSVYVQCKSFALTLTFLLLTHDWNTGARLSFFPNDWKWGERGQHGQHGQHGEYGESTDTTTAAPAAFVATRWAD